MSVKDPRNKVEQLLNDAMDYIAATQEQPRDPRAWVHLLVYCPEEVIAARMASIRDNREIRHTIDDVLRDLHYGAISLAEARARIVWTKAGAPSRS
jgi:hypothetical protein